MVIFTLLLVNVETESDDDATCTYILRQAEIAMLVGIYFSAFEKLSFCILV
jgi:hypothetical protein